ncbi:HalOD1 output domain-containing protein [Halalkaliarchaeum sp. AArc-GB]|uniref:HalOD1 output domain-containing protein n=1 Tax=Halalkaliarchaeum sp. AArc-GB TaxID=3074078 RepID=UPI00286189CF|nr:HalOD1 output domain-containing protein [Halalkaliarchaeum sp. AArc-GB]MDR5672557.1 HalOD1 output domain-containing protein [Halalkaliarchaeum sp. AArc-GB]
MKHNTRRSTSETYGASDVTVIGEAAAVRRFDSDDETDLTAEIVYAIAEARGVDPTEVTSPPLYESVDTVALQNLFFGDRANGAGSNRTLTLEFPYAEFLVRVDSDGTVAVYEG